MRSTIEAMETHQIGLYLLALAAGAGTGLAFPAIAGPAASAINPVLGLLLYATFLGVPFARLGQALRDLRFGATVLAVNFLVVPVVVFALSRPVAEERGVLVGVLFVLLTPCVDYVIVFTGLAGGARDRLLAVSPLLMLGQMVLLPLQVGLLAGGDVVAAIDPGPFVDAFVWLILVPLAAAGLTQAAQRLKAGRALAATASGAMVPLMMATLAVVVASQIRSVSDRAGALAAAVPLFVVFAAVMVALGWGAGRLARLDVPARRAVVFTGVTRNSLVVLPLALALPPALALAPLVVVTQTLVELLVMVVLVRLVPRLIPDTPA